MSITLHRADRATSEMGHDLLFESEALSTLLKSKRETVRKKA